MRISLFTLILLISILSFISCTSFKNSPNTETESQGPDTSEYSANDDNKLKIYTSLAEIEPFIDTDARFGLIYSFITWDTEALEKITNVVPGLYNELKTVKFGDFRVKHHLDMDQDDPESLVFNFEVTESQTDAFPVGTYEYYVYFSFPYDAGWLPQVKHITLPNRSQLHS